MYALLSFMALAALFLASISGLLFLLAWLEQPASERWRLRRGSTVSASQVVPVGDGARSRAVRSARRPAV